MTHLTNDELEELVTTINNRLMEFGPDVFDFMSYGVVRLVYSVIDEWQQRQDMEVVEEYAEARKQAYNRGYDRGFDEGFDVGFEDPRRTLQDGTSAPPQLAPEEEYMLTDAYAFGYERGKEAMRRELMGDEAETPRLVTMSAPEPDAHQPNGVIAAMPLAVVDNSGDKNDSEIVQPVEKEAPQNHAEKYTAATDETEWSERDQAAWHDELVAQGIDPYHPDPDPDGSLAAATYREAVEELVGKETIEAFESGADAPPKLDEKLTKPLSPTAAATLGPEHTIVTPLVPRRNAEYVPGGVSLGGPRTLADVWADEGHALDDDGDETTQEPGHRKRPSSAELRTKKQNLVGAAKGSQEQSDTAKARNVSYEQVIAELKRMAVGTKDMPTMAQWNESKPTHYPLANSICYKHNCSWPDLAKDAGLKMKQRGRQAA